MSQKVVISGGSKGLGEALVEQFLEEEWQVASFSRGGIGLRHDRLIASGLDITDPKSVEEFVERTVNAWQREACDVLINNASVLGPMRTIEEYALGQWREVIDVNLNGTFYLTHALLPHLKRGAVIINISSGAGIKGKPMWGAYAASKFAIEGFSQVLREELLDRGIRVHTVDPGAMQTEMRRQAYPNEDPAKNRTPREVARVIFDIAAVFEPQLLRLKAEEYL